MTNPNEPEPTMTNQSQSGEMDSKSGAAPIVATFVMADAPDSEAFFANSTAEFHIWEELVHAIAVECFNANEGKLVKSRGEKGAFLARFRLPIDAVNATADFMKRVAAISCELPGSIRANLKSPLHRSTTPPGFRCAIHHGSAFERENDFFGSTLNRCARIRSVAHAGQILLSQTVKEYVEYVLANDATILDLGLHRLRDLTQPERLFQLSFTDLPSKFPPVRSLDNIRHNLPLQLTSFVGRVAEQQELRSILRSHRMVTLTGAGGCGKTRLALQFATDTAEEYSDGAVLVELASITDIEMVPRVTLAAAGLVDTHHLSATDDLTEHFETRDLLFIFDNCEHVSDGVASVVEVLLSNCPKVRVLCTSRRPIGIAGEQLLKVSSLQFVSEDEPRKSDIAKVMECESVVMFLDRALAANPSLKISNEGILQIASICRRLDGMPLAIELAAPLLRVLPPRLLKDRLEESFKVLTAKSRGRLAQHQTIQATIEWSFELLSSSEKMLFIRLAVFSGGWSMEAAEAICSDDDVREDEVIFILARLEEHSLVQIDQSGEDSRRFRMIQAVHEFAVDKLYSGGDDEVFRERHFQWFLGLTDQAQEYWQGPKQDEWLDRIDSELDNLRGALEWGLASNRPKPLVMRMACSAARLWLVRGRVAEGRRWFARVLERDGEADASTEATTHNWAGVFAISQGDYESASQFLELGLAYFTIAEDSDGCAKALANLGMIERNLGRIDEAKARFRASADAFEKSGFKKGLAQALTNLGTVEYESRDFENAQLHLSRSLELHEELGDDWSAAMVLNNMGEMELVRGNNSASADLFLQSLAIWKRAGDVTSMTMSLIGLAILLARQGSRAEFARLVGFVTAIREEHALVPTPFESAELAPEIKLLLDELGSARAGEFLSEGATLDLDSACVIASQVDRT